ncbi:hypothetical protein PanABDRAFT_2488 [Pantoea sp. aB]|jgi:hypothetical protein|nr:hypothetical protein PanABDRAFT_2488 [Pantoea sp. aB]
MKNLCLYERSVEFTGCKHILFLKKQNNKVTRSNGCFRFSDFQARKQQVLLY